MAALVLSPFPPEPVDAAPQAGEHERAVRKYEKALRYIDQGGFLGEDKVQVLTCETRLPFWEGGDGRGG